MRMPTKTQLRKTITHPLFNILLVSGIIRMLYYTILLPTTDTDTTSYLNYHANLIKGQTEALRTPVYPYFIKLISVFNTSGSLLNHIVFAQCVLSLLSVIIFYKAAQLLLKT